MLYCAVLCYAMLCYAMLCYAMLCYAVLCYAMLYYDAMMLCYDDDESFKIAQIRYYNKTPKPGAYWEQLVRRRKQVYFFFVF